ncbi:MAG TPA: J domain-containing protein [Pirellulales bacterium]|nr:J domain-containing protein [Pirellulales bacterium]
MLKAAEKEPLRDRPAFMAVLGVLPPYELTDVREAFRAKVFVAHPDRGGDPADFIRLKEAYDQAVEYATFHGSRRAWIAAKVEQHLQREEVVAEVLGRGGRVEVERFAWMEKSWGDGFPLLAERLRHVFVRDMLDGDKFLAFLADHRLLYLVGLDVAGSRVSSEGLRHLVGYELLRWLDVSGTDVDCPALRSLLNCLPVLVQRETESLEAQFSELKGRRHMAVPWGISPPDPLGFSALVPIPKGF